MYFINHHFMKTYRGTEMYSYAFLTSALDRSELSASHPSRCVGEKAPGTH
jgi:hypothetical protein